MITGSLGADVIDGGDGRDTLDYSHSTTRVVIALDRIDSQGIGGAILNEGTTASDVINPRLTEMLVSGTRRLHGRCQWRTR